MDSKLLSGQPGQTLEERLAQGGWDVVELDPPPYGLKANELPLYVERISLIGRRMSEILAIPRTIVSFTDSRFGRRSEMHYKVVSDIEELLSCSFDKSRLLPHFTCNHPANSYEDMLNAVVELGYSLVLIISGDRLVDEKRA